MDDLTVRRDIWTSNLPSSEKSALSRVLSRVPGYSGLAGKVGTTVAATTEVAKGAAEAALAGGVVGAAQGYFGDSFGVPGFKQADGSYSVNLPTAAVAAGVAYGGAILFPQEDLAPTMRRAGDVALGIYVAGLAKPWVAGLGKGGAAPAAATGGAAQAAAPAATGHGKSDFGYDRICDLARRIG